MSSKIEEFRIKIEKELFKNRFLTVINNIGEDLFKELVIENCLPSMGLIDNSIELDYTPDICPKCNSGVLISDRCNVCLGVETNELINYSKYKETNSLLLDYPTNTTSIMIDGKRINIDLSKVNNWIIPNITPQLKYYKKGVEEITALFQELQITDNDTIDSIFSIFWNITTYFDKKDRSIFRPKEAKKTFYLLSIYYGLIYKGNNINISILNKKFEITSKTIMYYNSFMSKIFENGFLKSIIKKELFKSEIKFDVADFDNEYANHILEYLVEKNILQQEIYAYAGVVLYLSKDILNIPKYSKNAFILKTLNLTSVNSLNVNYYKVSNYFEKNQTLKDSIKNLEYI